VPHGIATVSINGSTRRLNVERLMPSASVAKVFRIRVDRAALQTLGW